MKKVTLIHTSFASVEYLTEMFKEILPGIELMHMVDDSLLKEVIKKGGITKNVIQKILLHIKSAEYSGSDCVLNVCSSIGEIVDTAKRIFEIPIIRIDEKMAEEAVARSSNIGVIATLDTTAGPTYRLLEKKAKKISKKVNITTMLYSEAFKELISGNTKKHDEIIIRGIEELLSKVDIIVLAQVSMAKIIENLYEDLAKRILTSPRSGVLEVKRLLTSKI
ncbi:MAG: aspartate/glutamate racemase family protein [Actinobacteria bacterium]|nr:aspartate/glutamate racemase family protein [Actinomycetota bacterium]